MKLSYKELLNTFEEIDDEDMGKEGRSYKVDYIIKEFEREREHMPSIVECYMKDHGVSRKEAIDEARKMIKSAWKDINQEFLKPTQVAMLFLMIVLNLARFLDVMYKNADTFTNSGGTMKEHLTLLFVDPVPI